MNLPVHSVSELPLTRGEAEVLIRRIVREEISAEFDDLSDKVTDRALSRILRSAVYRIRGRL